MLSHKLSGPSRFEGLLEEPNALREYDLLGFFAFSGKPPEKLFQDKPDTLQVRFCQPDVKGFPSVPGDTPFIEVRQLAGHINYLMKPAPESLPQPATGHWGSFIWPTKSVIQPNNIDPNRLGVVIHIGEDNEYAENLVPALFSVADTQPEQPVDHYSLVLRLQQTPVDSLSYQVTPAAGEPLPRCYYRNDKLPCLPNKPLLPTPIEINSLLRLTLDLSSVKPGPVAVHIEGKLHDQDGTFKANFHFDHRPKCL